MAYIELEDMKFFAYHGCFKEEKIIGNFFRVDLKLEGDFSQAAQSDNLQDALDYQQAYALVKEEMGTPSDLLEHVAGRILRRLHSELKLLGRATVKVSKKNPPIGGEMQQVSVTMSQ